MNAANYNWTEPINRASDKPGEIHLSYLRATVSVWEKAAVPETPVSPHP
jgi:hypothetical protein